MKVKESELSKKDSRPLWISPPLLSNWDNPPNFVNKLWSLTSKPAGLSTPPRVILTS